MVKLFYVRVYYTNFFPLRQVLFSKKRVFFQKKRFFEKSTLPRLFSSNQSGTMVIMAPRFGGAFGSVTIVYIMYRRRFHS